MAQDARIEAIAAALRAYDPTAWQRMPDIELYMDQAITYLKRQLALFQGPSDASLVTPSIINNYVKDGLVPRPVNKRYAQPQLAALTMACILKRVLPIERVKQVIAPGGEQVDEAHYSHFCASLAQALIGEAALLEDIDADMPLEELALGFAMRASADCLIADRLLALNKDQQNCQGEKKAKKPTKE
ncbi:MAG: DUF1836 domain-containing protein [Clostridia bacterium]